MRERRKEGELRIKREKKRMKKGLRRRKEE